MIPQYIGNAEAWELFGQVGQPIGCCLQAPFQIPMVAPAEIEDIASQDQPVHL